MPTRLVRRSLVEQAPVYIDIASKLAAHGITTRDALADLAGDELVELTGMDASKAQDLIMKARAHWFDTPVEASHTGAAA